MLAFSVSPHSGTTSVPVREIFDRFKELVSVLQATKHPFPDTDLEPKITVPSFRLLGIMKLHNIKLQGCMRNLFGLLLLKTMSFKWLTYITTFLLLFYQLKSNEQIMNVHVVISSTVLRWYTLIWSLY